MKKNEFKPKINPIGDLFARCVVTEEEFEVEVKA
jgi:hypothetical protein